MVRGDRPCIIGRDWLSCIPLNWKKIGKVVPKPSDPQDRLNKLLLRYEEVFSDTLGNIFKYKASLHLKVDAISRVFNPRPVPYALREQVGKKLDHLEKLGVLERTPCSEWAAPIVVVPKKDGRLRICGDYKVTINPSLDVDHYP